MNINLLFKNEQELLDEEPVLRLIDYIDQLKEQLIEMEQKNDKSKELIYLDLLQQIGDSVRIILKRDAENERFNLGDDTNWKDCVIGLKDAINEFNRIYKTNI